MCRPSNSDYNRVEIGSKRQDISLDRKFSKLFDGICCHFVSVEQINYDYIYIFIYSHNLLGNIVQYFSVKMENKLCHKLTRKKKNARHIIIGSSKVTLSNAR